MNQSKPGFDDRLLRNATWSAVLLAVAALAFFGFALRMVNFHDWEDYVLVGFPLLLAGTSLASIFVMRRGHLALGSGIIFSLNLMLPALLVFIVKNTLGVALLYALISSAMLIWRAMPQHLWRGAIVVTIAAMFVIVAIEIRAPSSRFSNPPVFNVFLVLLILVLLSAFIVQAVRQTWGRSMRNKLLTSFIGLTIVGSGVMAAYMFASTTNLLRQGLEAELTEHTDEAASSVGKLLNEQVNIIISLSLNEVIEQAVNKANQTYEGDAANIQATLDARDRQWRAADAANNNYDPLVRQYLSNSSSDELIEFQAAFPNHVEIFITDIHGGLAATTNRTSDYYQADEAWWQAAYNNGQGGIYISSPEFDESANALAVQIAVPIRDDDTGKIIGIARTTYLASGLAPILSEEVGNTGKTDLIIPGETISYYQDGQAYSLAPDKYAELQAAIDQGMVEMDFENMPSIVLQHPVYLTDGHEEVNQLGWLILYYQSQEEAYAPINTQIRGVLVVVGIVIIFAMTAALLLSLVLVRPITELTQTAEEVAAGRLSARAKIASTDEIGILASTFNSMTTQLQDILDGLEKRVAARTRDLAIVAEVGTATATILESRRLLQEVVELTKERFHLYHSHIYLLDEKGENLVLASGAGEPGRQMMAKGLSIPLNREQSLVARAARERKGISVNDVTEAPDFLPNPLLPDTRSELAVPMIVGGKVIGVFDVQSELAGRFTESDINVQMALAAQVATSIQNVRSFEQAKTHAELEALVNAIGQKIQRSTTVEDTLQIAVREVGLALGAVRVSANLQTIRQGEYQQENMK